MMAAGAASRGRRWFFLATGAALASETDSPSGLDSGVPSQDGLSGLNSAPTLPQESRSPAAFAGLSRFLE